jgi:hypothetical protein
MSHVLTAAGVYNLAWAAWMFLLPQLSFAYSGMEDPAKPLYYPQLWQGLGGVIGLFGVGYLIAARNPVRYWPVVFVGFLSKVFGPVGTALGVLTGQANPGTLLLAVPNDLVWWVPFLPILRRAYVLRGDA